MISQIREIVVEKKHWLDEDGLLQIITVAEATPGPIAINLATYVGYKREGFWGALTATAGIILPSLVILYIISLFFDTFLANKYVAYAFVGIKCAVAFLILRAGMDMLKKLPKKPVNAVLLVAVLVLMLLFELLSIRFSTIVLIVVGGGIGVASCAFGREVDGK